MCECMKSNVVVKDWYGDIVKHNTIETKNNCPQWVMADFDDVYKNLLMPKYDDLPEIKRVIFNLGTKAFPKLDARGKQVKDLNGKTEYGQPVPVLATVVEFTDGSKSVVTNSVHDALKLEPDGTVSESSKEAGVVYAIVKRLVGDIDENGTVLGNGFGRKLRDIVRNAYDTQAEEKARKLAKEKAKAEHEAKKIAAAAKPKNPCLVNAVKSLADITASLKTVVDKMADIKA